MTINIDRRKFEIPGSEAEAVNRKIQRLGKFFTDEATADVKFSEKRGMFTAEITVRAERMFFRAEERAADVLTATDGAIDAITRQIRKNKTKLENRVRIGALEKAVDEPVQQEEELVKRKHFDLRPMSEQDALLQMDLLNHSFYVFKDADLGGAVCVCYRRADGNYGIIETD